MLSRSGVSIRRLISPRRAQDEYEDGISVDTDRLDHKAAVRRDIGTTKRRPYSNKKRSPPPIIVSREQSIHDILDPLPPLPSYEPPRSSASSLDSYERPNESQSADSKRSKSPLCSISSKEDRSQESLQLSSDTSYGADEYPPEPPPKEELLGSTFDLTEALSVRRENKAAVSKQQLPPQEPFINFSDDIQLLIQEADEAFKAVGSALAEVQTTQNTLKELPRLPPRLPTPEPIPDSSPVLKPAALVTPPRMQNPPRQVVAASPIHSPRRNISVSSGVKRKKSKKSKKVKSMKPSRKPATPKSTTKSGPKWTLSDNVTELFSGKFFHKVEVDEMLTPGQLEQYRLRRMSIMQSEKSEKSVKSEKPADKSIDTLDTESSDTPIEPFHLDDLPSRIGSAGVKLNDDTPTDEKPSSSAFEPIAKRDFSVEGPNEGYGAVELPATTSRLDIGDEPVLFRNATFPTSTPPMRHPARFSLRGQRGILPSIPEASIISSPTSELYSGQNFRGSQALVADSNYVFLQSSPCSLTSPKFRHGPIRLAKSDLIGDMKVGADEGLDWTAFQMAISGGAGDWLTESDDTIRRREAEEIDELTDWFDSLHFCSPGGLLTQDLEVPSPTSTTSGEDYSDVSYTEIGGDNSSYSTPWQKPRHKMFPEGRQLEHDMSGLELDTSKMYLDDGDHAKEYGSRESYASLPQSPMLDLRVIRSPDGDDMDVVPMGYNLGHDLGDFLKWEAEHAYAGDFFSC
ncbi:hypothetical protein F5Y04DRAFT_278125 [Hypomontagnella monticulosa]|nr:hypothetical protein F5Y04DRAFT_278125 [Hypomontagnella monticulosa]